MDVYRAFELICAGALSADVLVSDVMGLDEVPERSKNWSSRLQEIEDSIQDIDIQAESNSISPEMWDRKQELRRQHYTILLEQELYWKQRFRVQWLNEGDLDTTFFIRLQMVGEDLIPSLPCLLMVPILILLRLSTDQ